MDKTQDRYMPTGSWRRAAPSRRASLALGMSIWCGRGVAWRQGWWLWGISRCPGVLVDSQAAAPSIKDAMGWGRRGSSGVKEEEGVPCTHSRLHALGTLEPWYFVSSACFVSCEPRSMDPFIVQCRAPVHGGGIRMGRPAVSGSRQLTFIRYVFTSLAEIDDLARWTEGLRIATAKQMSTTSCWVTYAPSFLI